jgi:hypothetical protein
MEDEATQLPQSRRTGDNATRNGGVHLDGQRRSGSCATKHGPPCEEQTFAAADVEELRLAILHENARAIRSAVATAGSPFHFEHRKKGHTSCRLQLVG